MQHKTSLNISSWLRSAVLTIGVVLLFALSVPDRAAAVTSTNSYVGSDRDFFYEHYATVYATDDVPAETIMEWFDEIYADCPLFINMPSSSNASSTFAFFPSDVYNFNFVDSYFRSYSRVDHYYIFSYSSDTGVTVTKHVASSVVFSSDFYKASSFSRSVVHGNGSAVSLDGNFYIRNEYFCNSNFSIYYYPYGRESYYFEKNIFNLRSGEYPASQLIVSDVLSVLTTWGDHSVRTNSIKLTYNLVSVNSFGNKKEFQYVYSDADNKGSSKEGEYPNVTDAAYLSFRVDLANLVNAAPVTAVNIYIDSVYVELSHSDTGEVDRLFNDTDLYLVVGDEGLVNFVPDYNYNDKYDGPEGDYNTGIDSSGVAGKYNLTPIKVNSDGSTVENIPDWADVLVLYPTDYTGSSISETLIPLNSLTRFYLSFAQPGLGTDSPDILRVDSLSLSSINLPNFTYNYFDPLFDDWTVKLGDYSSSYDVIYFCGFSLTCSWDHTPSVSHTYDFSTFAYATERLYKRAVCYNMTDGFSMMGDYLFDLSEQNNSIYNLLYSGLSDAGSPFVQLRNNSITQVNTLNSILTGINKLQPLSKWEPFDDAELLSGIGSIVSAIDAQDLSFGVPLLQTANDILNRLNATDFIDHTDILDKIDELIGVTVPFDDKDLLAGIADVTAAINGIEIKTSLDPFDDADIIDAIRDVTAAINSIDIQTSFEPFDDAELLSGIGSIVAAIDAQEDSFGLPILTNVQAILNKLDDITFPDIVFPDPSDPSGTDLTPVLDKLDAVIDAVNAVSVSISVSQQQQSFLDRILDALSSVFELILSFVSRFISLFFDVISSLVDSLSVLFDHVTWLFTHGLSADQEYLNVFDSDDSEVSSAISGAREFLSIIPYVFSAFPLPYRLLFIFGVLATVLIVIFKEVL